MGAKSVELINMMMKQQERLRLIYKNVSVIDGQYDVRLKTAAKVVSEVLMKRKAHYQELLLAASESSDDASEEGYRDIEAAIVQYGETISQQHFGDLYDYINYVSEKTDMLLQIVELAIDRINKNDLNQESIQSALIQIKAIENEFIVILRSFNKNTKQLA